MVELDMYVLVPQNFQPQLLIDLICEQQFIQMVSI